MKKILAFDIDGTLNDNMGNLQPGVENVLLDKRFKNCTALLVTGNTLTTVKRVKNQINIFSNTTIPTNTYSSAFGGAVVYDNNYNIIYKKHLCRKKIRKILEKTEKIDPEFCFLLMHLDCQTFGHIVNQKMQNKIDQSKHLLNLNLNEIIFNNEHFSTLLPKLPSSFLLNIYCPNKAEEVFKQLLPFEEEFNLSIYYFSKAQMIQICASKKINALKYMVSKLKENKQFDGTIKDVVYFGDCANDVGCLKACDISFARGSNLEEYVVKNSKYYADDLTPYLDTIFK